MASGHLIKNAAGHLVRKANGHLSLGGECTGETSLKICGCCIGSAATRGGSLPTLGNSGNFPGDPFPQDLIDAHNAIVAADFVMTQFDATAVVWTAYSATFTDGFATLRWKITVDYCSGDILAIIQMYDPGNPSADPDGWLEYFESYGYFIAGGGSCCETVWAEGDITPGASEMTYDLWNITASGGPLTITNNHFCVDGEGNCIAGNGTPCTGGVNTCL